MAADFGFDAVNADRSLLKERGPGEAIELMKHYDLQPVAFAFSAAFNQCHFNTEFDRSLAVFEHV